MSCPEMANICDKSQKLDFGSSSLFLTFLGFPCAGAVVSAAICGIIVTRKIQAYANVLKKASEGSEARNKEKAKELKAAAKPAPSPCKENVLVRALLLSPASRTNTAAMQPLHRKQTC